MSTFAAAFKEEISRLARKEVKKLETTFRKDIVNLKSTCRDLSKRLAAFEKDAHKIRKVVQVEREKKITPTEEEVKKSRITPAGIKRIRDKYDLSRKDMALALGVNQNSIFLWESGKTVPRMSMKAKILELRSMGKRMLNKRLKEINPPEETPKEKEATPKKTTASKKSTAATKAPAKKSAKTKKSGPKKTAAVKAKSTTAAATTENSPEVAAAKA